MASDEELKSALKLFRKKLRHLIAEEEARGGGKFGFGGRKSSINAITPPYEFSKEIWEELAQKGKLKKEQQGLYSLVGEL